MSERTSASVDVDGDKFAQITLTGTAGRWTIRRLGISITDGSLGPGSAHAVIDLPPGPVALVLENAELGWCYLTPRSPVDASDGVTHLLVDGDSITQTRSETFQRLRGGQRDVNRYHLCPPRGWLNDPNGLVFHRGRHHAFFQFHPQSSGWGPMHWGHAVSDDLTAWAFLPIPLWPSTNGDAATLRGGAYSGSALSTEDAIDIWFTRHVSSAADGVFRETQHRVRLIGGIEAGVERLVIPEAPAGVGPDFRDPKVVMDPATGELIMVLGATEEGAPVVVMYRSQDGGDQWTYCGVIYRPQRPCRTVECPDLFPLDGRWVLVVALLGSEDTHGRQNLSVAVVGTLHGDVFTSVNEQVLDFGTDFYAFQTYQAGQRRLGMAWLGNWASTERGEHETSVGTLSAPRELALRGDQLLMPVAAEMQRLRGSAIQLIPGQPLRDMHRTCEIEIHSPATVDWSVTVAATRAGAVGVSMDGRQLRLMTPDDGAVIYSHPVDGPQRLHILVDRSSIEVIADGGRVTGSRRYYHAVDDTILLTTSSAGVAATVWPLRTILGRQQE